MVPPSPRSPAIRVPSFSGGVAGIPAAAAPGVPGAPSAAEPVPNEAQAEVEATTNGNANVNATEGARLSVSEQPFDRPVSVASSTGMSPNYENRDVISANADAHESGVRFAEDARTRDAQYREVFLLEASTLIVK